MTELEIAKRAKRLSQEIGGLFHKESRKTDFNVFIEISFIVLNASIVAHIASLSKNTKEDRLNILKDMFEKLEIMLTSDGISELLNKRDEMLNNRTIRVAI